MHLTTPAAHRGPRHLYYPLAPRSKEGEVVTSWQEGAAAVPQWDECSL